MGDSPYYDAGIPKTVWSQLAVVRTSVPWRPWVGEWSIGRSISARSDLSIAGFFCWVRPQAGCRGRGAEGQSVVPADVWKRAAVISDRATYEGRRCRQCSPEGLGSILRPIVSPPTSDTARAMERAFCPPAVRPLRKVTQAKPRSRAALRQVTGSLLRWPGSMRADPPRYLPFDG
jgi:hypothetical protein